MMTCFAEKYELYNSKCLNGVLSVNGMQLKPEDVPSIKAFLLTRPDIYRLNIQGNRIGSEGARILSSIDTITELNAEVNNIGDEGTNYLAKSKNLKYLNLGHNNITDAGVTQLLCIKTLRKLILNGNKITDIGAKTIAQNTTLTEVSLCSNLFGDDGAKALASNFTIKKLFFAFNEEMTQIGKDALHERDPIKRMQYGLAVGVRHHSIPSLQSICIYRLWQTNKDESKLKVMPRSLKESFEALKKQVRI